MRTVGVRVPVAAYEQLCAVAADQGMPAAAVARDLLVRALAGPHVEAVGVEGEVRKDLDALITEHPMGEALAAMSLNLARVLDAGAGLAVAAVNRELRENLRELAEFEAGDDDDRSASGVPPSMVNPEDDL